MNNSFINDLIDKVLSLGGNVKVVYLVLVVVSMLFGFACIMISKDPHNAATEAAEEVAAEVIKKGTGLDVEPILEKIDVEMDKLINGKDKDTNHDTKTQ